MHLLNIVLVAAVTTVVKANTHLTAATTTTTGSNFEKAVVAHNINARSPPSSEVPSISSTEMSSSIALGTFEFYTRL